VADFNNFWRATSGRNSTQMTVLLQIVLTSACEWCQRLPLAFALEEDILSTCCNKEDVM